MGSMILGATKDEWDGSAAASCLPAHFTDWHNYTPGRIESSLNRFPWFDAMLTERPWSWNLLRPEWQSCKEGRDIRCRACEYWFQQQATFHLLYFACYCGAGKVLYFITHNLDASLVWCVQFQHSTLHQLGAVEFVCQCQDGGCFTSTWRTVKEQVRQLIMPWVNGQPASSIQGLTLSDCSAFFKTSTACSCEEMSSMVFGRLAKRLCQLPCQYVTRTSMAYYFSTQGWLFFSKSCFSACVVLLLLLLEAVRGAKKLMVWDDDGE